MHETAGLNGITSVFSAARAAAAQAGGPAIMAEWPKTFGL